jgi:hypothetical protein
VGDLSENNAQKDLEVHGASLPIFSQSLSRSLRSRNLRDWNGSCTLTSLPKPLPNAELTSLKAGSMQIR